MLLEREREEVKRLLLEEARAFYDARERELGPDHARTGTVILLRTVDRHWMYYIDEMHQLRQEINLRAYGQRDPRGIPPGKL